MKTFSPSIFRGSLSWICLIVLFGHCFAESADPFSELQSKYQVALADVKAKGEAESKRLNDGYVGALVRLENEFQNAGKLDLLLKARKEREQFQESSKPGEDATPDLARLKAILDQKQKPVIEKVSASVSELTQKYLEQLEILQADLTKLGKIDEAVKVRTEVETVRASLSKPSKMAEGSTLKQLALTGDKKFTPVPAISPKPVNENPFRDGNWPVAMAIPEGNYRIEGNHQIKGEKDRQLLLTAGSSFVGTDNASWMVGNSLVVAKDVSFRKFSFRGDLGSVFHFENCDFEDMNLGKGGGWFGGAYMSRWQLKNCTVKGSFIERWNIKHTGVQIIGGQFERVEFPSIEYESDQDPSVVALHEWATFSGVRFRKCKLPASVLSLAENCEFEECRFVDDSKPVEFKSPISRILYVTNCTDAQRTAPKNLNLEKKPLSDRRAP